MQVFEYVSHLKIVGLKLYGEFSLFQDVEEVKVILRKFVTDTPGDSVVLVRKKGYLLKGSYFNLNSEEFSAL